MTGTLKTLCIILLLLAAMPARADDALTACRGSTAWIGLHENDSRIQNAVHNRPKARVRLLHPWDSMTKDLRPDRLNIRLNALSVVTGVDCG